MQNMHRSGGDVSAATDVACYFNSGNGSPAYVKQIVISGYFNNGNLDCNAAKSNRYSLTMPCHTPYTGPGEYVAHSTAQVEYNWQTKSASVDQSAYF